MGDTGKWVEIGEVARADGAGALLLIDEMQNLDAASLGARGEARARRSHQPETPRLPAASRAGINAMGPAEAGPITESETPV